MCSWETLRAFLNIGIDKEDRDSVRFLWIKDPPDLSRVVVYRFCRFVFGLDASPFLLNATLRHHITKFMDDDPDFVSKLLESFYVDDFVGGGASSEEVTDLYSKTSRRMLDGGFKLRKWMTNDARVRGKIESDSSDVVTQRAVAREDMTNDTTVTKKTKSNSNAEVTHKKFQRRISVTPNHLLACSWVARARRCWVWPGIMKKTQSVSIYVQLQDVPKIYQQRSVTPYD